MASLLKSMVGFGYLTQQLRHGVTSIQDLAQKFRLHGRSTQQLAHQTLNLGQIFQSKTCFHQARSLQSNKPAR